MAGGYVDAIKAARMARVQLAVEAGSGPGKLQIRSAFAVVLAEFACDNPSVLAGAVLTLIAVSSSTVGIANGTAASAALLDSDGNLVRSGMSVGLSGADVNLSSLIVAIGQELTLGPATLTHV